MKHYLNNSSIMDYNTLITRLENLYLPLFSWPISAKHVLNNEIVFGRTHYAAIEYILSVAKCKKQVFDQQFSEKLVSADFGKQLLHILIDKAVMRQRAAASLLGA